MSLTISDAVLLATKTPALESTRTADRRFRSKETTLEVSRLSNDDLADVLRAATEAGESKTKRAVEAILAARDGQNLKIPNFKAFEGMLLAFLKAGAIDHWLYVEDDDGKLYPELITKVVFKAEGRNEDQPAVHVHTTYYGLQAESQSAGRLEIRRTSHRFVPGDVTNKRVADALAAKGLYKETAALRAAYDEEARVHADHTIDQFGKQFRFTGVAYRLMERPWERRHEIHDNRKVINDLDEQSMGAFSHHDDSDVRDGAGEIPRHLLVRIFDLRTHEFLWAHSSMLTPYAYDKTMGDKLILPQSHRDLLDVLTRDLDAFTADFIEGKSAGNIILCKGRPGTGKTATAEVYSELIEAPLYSIHTGTLGTTASEIQKRLQTVFERAKRWDCPILLDEADVFVCERGNNIEQNAIVAEFLRVLEYQTCLMFLTTNRPDDIDDAILSRTAAIIHYEVPERSLAAEVWQVMFANAAVALDPRLLEQLLDLFPQIAQRDIKNLLKLVLKMAKRYGKEPDIELFRHCAMFRGVQMRQVQQAA